MAIGRPSKRTPATPPHTVYVLEDETGRIRYVGVTADPSKRLGRHIRESRRSDTHRATWIRSMLSAGKMPTLRVVESGVSDWREAECRWIAKCRNEGFDLVNGNDGGECVPRRMLSGQPNYPNVRLMMIRLGGAAAYLRKACAEGYGDKDALATVEAKMDVIRARLRSARKRGTIHLIEAKAKDWNESKMAVSNVGG